MVIGDVVFFTKTMINHYVTNYKKYDIHPIKKPLGDFSLSRDVLSIEYLLYRVYIISK